MVSLGDHLQHILFLSSVGHGSVRPVLTAPVEVIVDKKAVLLQGNRAMPQVFFSVEVRQQHSLQV